METRDLKKNKRNIFNLLENRNTKEQDLIKFIDSIISSMDKDYMVEIEINKINS